MPIDEPSATTRENPRSFSSSVTTESSPLASSEAPGGAGWPANPPGIDPVAGYPATRLPKRAPQTSDGALLDRSMSWSGRLFPLPEPCRDVELMRRVVLSLRLL